MNNNNYNQKESEVKYWLVDFTLTSGEILNFYIKAKTKIDAEEKAEDYVYWLKDESLKKQLMTFKLMS